MHLYILKRRNRLHFGLHPKNACLGSHVGPSKCSKSGEGNKSGWRSKLGSWTPFGNEGEEVQNALVPKLGLEVPDMLLVDTSNQLTWPLGYL